MKSVTIDTTASQRLAEVRHQAAEKLTRAMEELGQAGPPDPLGAIAWAVGTGADAGTLRSLVDEARRARMTWREISDAMGDGTDEPAARRVAERFRSWSRSPTSTTLRPAAAERT